MKRNVTVELILDMRKGDKVVVKPLGDVVVSEGGRIVVINSYNVVVESWFCLFEKFIAG